MKKILTLIGILSILCGINKAEAQLIPQFSQYMFNGLYINPAYAGYKDVLYGHVMYRKQWVNVESSPRTAMISVDGPLKGGSNLGLVYANDKLGAAYSNNVMVDYSYRFKVSENSRLSFGLAAGIIQHGINKSELRNEDLTTDPRVLSTETVWKPAFDAGVYFDAECFYAGLSVVGLLKNTSESGKEFLAIRTNANYFLTFGGIVPLNSSLKLMPSTLFGTDFKNPLKIDLTMMLMIADKFSVGSSYRMGAKWFSDVDDNVKSRGALVFLAEAFVSERVRIGFAYDLDLKKMNTGHNGGFEISLGYYLTKAKQKHVTPRYF